MLIIVRHGRTEANAQRLLQGRMNLSLDEMGRSQARAVAAALPRPDRVVASPLLRARETAEAFGAPIEIDDRWVELDYGELDGMPIIDVPPALWVRWRTEPDFAPPGGESLAALGKRVRGACDALVEAAATETVVVVTHVSPIKAALGWVTTANDAINWRAFVGQASVMRIATDGPSPSLHSFNETNHLG